MLGALSTMPEEVTDGRAPQPEPAAYAVMPAHAPAGAVELAPALANDQCSS